MKSETVYSQADWKYHKNKLGYDDIINEEGRLVATVGVMDIAVHDLLNNDASDDCPKEIFMISADGCWSFFIDETWLTPQKVQTMLDKLGKLTNRKFLFEPYQLPKALEQRYQKDRERYEKEIDEGHATPLDISKLSDWRETDIFKESEKDEENKSPAVSDKRLAAILMHKLKM